MVLFGEVTLGYTCIRGCKLNSGLLFCLKLSLTLHLSYADKHTRTERDRSVNPAFTRPKLLHNEKKTALWGNRQKRPRKKAKVG